MNKDKNNESTPEKKLNPLENAFEPVKLNLPESKDMDDENLSSLFGEKNFTQINPFVYEKDLLGKANSKNQFNLNPKFLKIGVASIALVGLVSFSISSLLSSDNSKISTNFKKDNEAIIKVISQNSTSKQDDIKEKVASGKLLDEKGIIEYKLREGDSIEELSKKLNISVDTLKFINDVKDVKELEKKQNIVIPSTNGFIHKVTSNETLETIAIKYKVPVDKIIKANTLKNPHFLNIDQTLFIPTTKGEIKPIKQENNVKVAEKNDVSGVVKPKQDSIIHKLAPGENLDILAKRYRVPIEEIISINHIKDPFRLQINQPIIIPVNSNAALHRTKIASRSYQYDMNSRFGRMLTPARGSFTSNYGYRWGRFHRGIDIAGPYGTPILSAMTGQVVYSGWESGYGKTIKIKHSNGIITRYAHCSRVYVKTGQHVYKGQNIASMGSTGRSTGSHLHFEVLVNGKHVNPKNYL